MKSYAAVLAVPGAAAASLAALVARLPLSMAGLGIVLLVSGQEGSYGAAGAVTAAYIVAAAIGAPVQGRLGDAIGQRIVLLAAGTVFVVGVGGFLLAVHSGAPRSLSLLAVSFAGLGAPQAGSFIRARWTVLLRDRGELLQTAFALEAVIDEVVFIVGPIAVTVIATAAGPFEAMATVALLALVGSIALASTRRADHPTTDRAVHRRPPLGLVFVAPIVAVSVGIGILFGSVEVLVVAFATDLGQRGLSGLVLAAWASGSLLAGLGVGAMRPARNQIRRLQFSLTGLALTFVPMLWIDSLGWLSLALFLGGFLIAPSLISAVSLIQAHVPASRLTEGIAWSTTGMAVGVAPGAAVVGQIIDQFGTSTAFGVPLVAGLLAALAAWLAIPPALRHVQRKRPEL